MITPAQCRAARSLLGWNWGQLAAAAALGIEAAVAFETGQSKSRPSTREKLRRAFEAAGVVFVEPNGLGPGVRLRDRGGEE